MRGRKIRNAAKKNKLKGFSIALAVIFITILSIVIIPSKGSSFKQKKEDYNKPNREKIEITAYEEKEIPLGNKRPPRKVNKAEATNKNNKVKEGDKALSSKKTKKKSTYREYFKDSVFLGDSITECLSYYELIKDARVVSHKGMTIKKAYKRIDDVVKMKPKKVFILFGMNDMLMGMTGEEFSHSYSLLIKKIRERLPGSEIYIQSVLPVEERIEEQRPLMSSIRVKEFNNAIIEMAKKEKVNCLNISSVLDKTKENLHEPDGIHYKYKFYELWLDYIMEYLNKN